MLFLLYSITKTNYAAKIPSTVQLLKRRNKTIHLANCYLSSISSKRVFIAVSDFGARKRNYLKPYTSIVQFSPPRPGKGQIHHPGKALPDKFPTPRAQKIVKSPRFFWLDGKRGLLKFRFDRRIISQRAEGSMIRYTIFILKRFQRSHKAFKIA